jgi:hypothetical protein
MDVYLRRASQIPFLTLSGRTFLVPEPFWYQHLLVPDAFFVEMAYEE